MSRQKELRDAINELALVKDELSKLNARRNELEDIVSSLKASCATGHAGNGNKYDRTDFSWSKILQEKLQSVFKINEFRSLQLSAINATMNKEGTKVQVRDAVAIYDDFDQFVTLFILSQTAY